MFKSIKRYILVKYFESGEKQYKGEDGKWWRDKGLAKEYKRRREAREDIMQTDDEGVEDDLYTKEIDTKGYYRIKTIYKIIWDKR
jgi:hypothetical protein